MNKINFQNNITKCNADTFNTMQDNIEDAIKVNAITISLSSNQSASIPSEYGVAQINFDTQKAKVGDGLTFDSTNHLIKIGSGINYIEISSNIVIANGSNSYGDRYLNIFKRTSGTGTAVAQCYYLNSIATNNHYPLTIPPVIIPVSENDEIYCMVSSAITETLSIRGGSVTRSFLTVKVIN